MNNNSLAGLLKVLLIMAVIVYIVSPIDVAPGPIDDIIAALIGLAGTKKLSVSKS